MIRSKIFSKATGAMETAAAADPAAEPSRVDASLFVPADFDASAGERGGYSNYSYWRSTMRGFLRNRVALGFLVLLGVLLLFTFVQPLLPGQNRPLPRGKLW